MSISGIGGIAADAMGGAGESLAGAAFDSALSAVGLGGVNPQQLLEAAGGQMLMQMMMPMMENMVAQTPKVMKGDSSGLL